MEQQMKQRLVGAVTLVSLGVIFLPMIFDGSGYDRLPDADFDIPAQPEMIFDQSFENLPARGEVSVKKLLEDIDVRELPENPEQGAAAADWVVQAGVFSHENNARLRVRRLTDAGYNAQYQEQELAPGGEPRFLVEVGPGTEKQMQRTADKLRNEIGIKDVLIRRR